MRLASSSELVIASNVVATFFEVGRKKKKNSSRQNPAKKGYFEVAVVEGEFLNFDGHYRYALSAVDDLEKAMKESGNYFSVDIIKRPLDIESDNSLAGDAGVGKVIVDDAGFMVAPVKLVEVVQGRHNISSFRLA